ncbi:MAG: hypothetical protein ACI84D_003550 [Thalassolituus oleivorans]|jgi:hypothetical protein
MARSPSIKWPQAFSQFIVASSLSLLLIVSLAACDVAAGLGHIQDGCGSATSHIGDFDLYATVCYKNPSNSFGVFSEMAPYCGSHGTDYSVPAEGALSIRSNGSFSLAFSLPDSLGNLVPTATRLGSYIRSGRAVDFTTEEAEKMEGSIAAACTESGTDDFHLTAEPYSFLFARR